MFAKLKKKIEDSGGNVSDVERNVLPVPGHASPLRPNSNSATPVQSPMSKDKLGYESDSSTRTNPQSPTGSVRDEDVSGSKEDLLAMLMKRTEQCKKLEGKISEYAAIIKEKNRNVEKLETALEKQQDAHAKRIQELNEQYQSSRAKLSEGFTLALQKKDEEKQELLDKIKEAEEYKEKVFKREEENDEFQGLATQELAKVKHMLLNTQEELAKVKKEMTSKSEAFENSEKVNKELQNQITSLQDQLKTFQSKCHHLEEESSAQAALVNSMADEQQKLQNSSRKQLEELTELSNQLTTQVAEKSELENDHQALQRNFDIHKNKTSVLIQEKDDHIDQLQDRVKTLEQRFQDQNLSGDDREQAIEAERISLENKLEETRQQLTQVKSTWSDKITHLEQQISHLNQKISEDNEEMVQSQKHSETMRENFHKQIESMQVKLEDAEKRAEENWQLANRKDTLYQNEKHELETELNKLKLEKIDLETQLRANITSLESQVTSLEEAREQDKMTSNSKIEHFESQENEYLEKAVHLEKKIEEVEKERNTVMNENETKTEEITKLKSELKEQHTKNSQLTDRVIILEEQIKATDEKLDNHQKSSKDKHLQLQGCVKEKDELLLRNAELSQELKTLEKSSESRCKELETEVEQKEIQTTNLQQSVDQLNDRIQQYETQIEELQNKHDTSLQSGKQMETLQKTVVDLEQQLLEKNKTLKKQEQRLTDLKKTLQRELKVQALPNDDPVVMDGSLQTPPIQRKVLSTSPRTSPPRTSVENKVTDLQHQSFSKNNGDSSARMGFVPSENSVGKIYDGRGAHPLEKDINFQYLKHVVLKFMLSRESEAVQLIRAVSMLLKFTIEEQRLIKETLEYKMSWFGSKPAGGSGQLAKIVPPSYH